jgi:hypothetical protein
MSKKEQILLENIFNAAYIIEEAVNDKEKKGSKSSSHNDNNNDKYGTLKRWGGIPLGMLLGHGIRDIYNKLNEDDEYTKVAKMINAHHEE